MEILEARNHQDAFKNAKKDFADKNINLFLDDLKIGRNVSGKKGRRSYARLNAHRLRLKMWEEWVDEKYQKKLTDLSHKELTTLYYELETGKIRKKDGGFYKSYCDYGKTIKAFWHWYQKHMRLEHQRMIIDITEDIATNNSTKSDFNYFDYEGFQKLIEKTPSKHRALLWFLYDSGIRAPKELINIRINDLSNDPESNKFLLNIRDEVSKTFGRKIKLMLSSTIIKQHIKKNKLKGNDQLFNINSTAINKMLSKVGYDALNIGKAEIIEETDKRSKSGKIKRTIIKNGLHLYDFRHNSACYWVQRYKKETIIRYRFGWKRSDKIEYYTNFLGIKDDIHEEDLFLKSDQTALEKKFSEETNTLKDQIAVLQEALITMSKNSGNKELIKKLLS